MRIRILRSDGGTGLYSQTDARRAGMLALRLDPARIYTSGTIVLGTLNPFTLLNPDEVCAVTAEGHPGLQVRHADGVESIRRIPTRADYEALLNRQWPKWRSNARSEAGDLLEALVELSLRGGATEHLHVVGRVTKASLIDGMFGMPSICASVAPDGVMYLNPRAITRARVYHSAQEVPLPDGVWMTEADEI